MRTKAGQTVAQEQRICQTPHAPGMLSFGVRIQRYEAELPLGSSEQMGGGLGENGFVITPRPAGTVSALLLLPLQESFNSDPNHKT